MPGLPCRGSGAGPSCSIVSDRVARIAAAGGAFAFEDEVDPAKFARSFELKTYEPAAQSDWEAAASRFERLSR